MSQIEKSQDQVALEHEGYQLEKENLIVSKQKKEIRSFEDLKKGNWISISGKYNMGPSSHYYFDIGQILEFKKPKGRKGKCKVKLFFPYYEGGQEFEYSICLTDYDADRQKGPTREGLWRLLQSKN